MKTEVTFLEISEVLLIHEDQIENYGGKEGIRAWDLIESAVKMPRTTFDGNYLHKSIFDKASAYIFHLAQNHPFLDGNKRTALATGLVFLDINGIELDDVDEELYEMMINTSEGRLNKQEISKILETLSL